MKYLFFFILVIFFFTSSFSQEKAEMDALEIELKNNLPDSLRVKYLIELSNFYGDKNNFKSEKFGLNALDIIQSKQRKENYWTKQEAEIFDNLGVIERKNGNHDTALKYYLNALQIKETYNDTLNIGRSYHNIGMLFNSREDYDKARVYYLKALKFRFRYNDSVKYAKTLNIYGSFLLKQNKLDSAQFYFNKAILFFNTDVRVADVNRNLAILHSKSGDDKKAIKLYNANIKLYKTINENYKLCVNLLSLSKCHRRLNNLNLTKEYLEEAKKIALQFNYKHLLSNIYLDEYRIYKLQHNYKDALVKYETYKKYNDTIYNAEKLKIINALELEYNYEKQKTENQLVLEKQKSKNTLYATLLAITALLLVLISILFRNKQKRNKTKQKQQALEKQIVDEKLKWTTYQAKQVVAINKMELQFKEEFLKNITLLKKNKNISNTEIQSLIIDLKSQITTQTKFKVIEENISNKMDEEFIKKLNDKFPNLTKGEREIVGLMRMNLSIKEIMIISNSTMPSIKSSRYRIRKKMNISKNVELEQFIQQLFLA